LTGDHLFGQAPVVPVDHLSNPNGAERLTEPVEVPDSAASPLPVA